jgi:hypothetical protein
MNNRVWDADPSVFEIELFDELCVEYPASELLVAH